MIPMVEYLIKKTIEENLKQFKTNPDIIENLFSFLPDEDVAKLKQHICNKNIPVIIGFPREPALMPCYCIILGQEAEIDAGLGMDFYDDVIEDNIETGVLETNVQFDFKSNLNYIDISNIIKPIKSIDCLKNVSGENIDFQLDEKNKRIIVKNKSVFLKDVFLVEYSYYSTGVETIGTMFNINYQIECWSDNADLTVYMYHIAKYIMLKMRHVLTKNGLVKHNLSGGDIEPIPEYFPTFVFRRSLVFNSLVDNSIENKFDFIQSVDVSSGIFNE